VTLQAILALFPLLGVIWIIVKLVAIKRTADMKVSDYVAGQNSIAYAKIVEAVYAQLEKHKIEMTADLTEDLKKGVREGIDEGAKIWARRARDAFGVEVSQAVDRQLEPERQAAHRR